MLADDAAVSEPTRERARHEARRYYLLALAAARRPLSPARIIVTAGAIASGKSTVANALSRELLAPVLCADRARKELMNVELTRAQHDPSFGGAYSEAATQRVYMELVQRALPVLESGRSVIFDASFRSRALRAQVRELGQRLELPVTFVECRCPREVAMQRLRARAQQPSISDGRAEIYDDFMARFEPLTELAPHEHLVLDTTAPCAASLTTVLKALASA
jgi:predicted kinase